MSPALPFLLTEVQVGNWRMTVERDGAEFAVTVLDMRDERTRLSVETANVDRALELAHAHIVNESKSETTADALRAMAQAELARKAAIKPKETSK